MYYIFLHCIVITSHYSIKVLQGCWFGLGPWSFVVLKDETGVHGPVLGLEAWVLVNITEVFYHNSKTSLQYAAKSLHWSEQKSRTGCCRNVQQCPPHLCDLRRYSIENCKFLDFNHHTLGRRQFCEKSRGISTNNLRCQKLKSHRPTWQRGSMFVTFHAIIFESQTFWVKTCWPKTDFVMK